MRPFDTDRFIEFLDKYGIELLGNEEITIEIEKEHFDKETLMNHIKEMVCKNYVDNDDNDLLVYMEKRYQPDEYLPETSMEVYIYTDQECSETRFLKDLESFVDKIIKVYNKQRTLRDIRDDMLPVAVTYVVDFPKSDFTDSEWGYVFLGLEDIYEKNGVIYITLGIY